MTRLTKLPLDELEKRYHEEFDHIYTGIVFAMGIAIGTIWHRWGLLIGAGLFILYRVWRVYYILQIVKQRSVDAAVTDIRGHRADEYFAKLEEEMEKHDD